MKKFLSVFLALLLCLSLAACGGEEGVAVTNDLGYELTELYISPIDADTWGDNLLAGNAEGGHTTMFLISTYSESDTGIFDICAVDVDGDSYSFFDVALSDGASLKLSWPGDDPEAVVTPKKGDAVTYAGEFVASGDPGPESDSLSLPTPDDPLTEEIDIPDFSPAITVRYPDTMFAKAMESSSYTLQLDALYEEELGEVYNAIVVKMIQINDFDPYFTSGYGRAKEGMTKIAEALPELMFSGKFISALGSDFTDGGWYYEMLYYTWMDGGVFVDDISTPVRAVFDVRYVGPTGYVLVTVTLAEESRIQNYYDIARNIMDSIDWGGDWSTAPKTVPSSGGAGGAWSDTGDYGDTYYWYDSDGDVWYWNGYEDVFIGYGDSYYIDGDQYYESNDAGWDDYDPWSDPGDYDYYDDWSDPGDYGYYDDWSDSGDYYDDGTGDYFY
jgi:hypothetical protein